VFLQGDAAWSLQVQLSDDDIQTYLADRAAKGFNAIWVGLADNTYSDHAPADFYGNKPFHGADFTNEDPAYWKRVDQTLTWAAERGIAVLASPAFVGYGCKQGYCESYRNASISVLREYGEFLGRRYAAYPNILWLIGGDADPFDANVQEKLNALASGISATDSAHLIAAESYRGFSSADVWSETAWLDLNGVYALPPEIPAQAAAAHRNSGYPVFLMEDWYEGEHGITELEVRKEGYWAVLSGCTLGRMFGNYAIWNFSWGGATKDSWKSQLDSEGSTGQSLMGRLFRSREHWKLVPDLDHTVMTSGYDPSSDGAVASAKEQVRRLLGRPPRPAPAMLSVAARTSDGQTIIAYIPNGNAASVSIDMTRITDAASQAKAWWYNPRTGSSTLIGTLLASGAHTFTPPAPADWVLVIDSLAAGLDAPAGEALSSAR